LHQHQSDGKFFVKIFFKKGWDGQFIQYKLNSLGGKGCDLDCTFNNFETIVKNDSIPKDWCKECKFKKKIF
jgi:hypothetical protein